MYIEWRFVPLRFSPLIKAMVFRAMFFVIYFVIFFDLDPECSHIMHSVDSGLCMCGVVCLKM